jgi:hypothetical protein
MMIIKSLLWHTYAYTNAVGNVASKTDLWTSTRNMLVAYSNSSIAGKYVQM